MSLDWNTMLEEANASTSVQRSEAETRLFVEAGETKVLRLTQVRVPKELFSFNSQTMPSFMKDWDNKRMCQVTFLDNANQELTYTKDIKHSLIKSIIEKFNLIGYKVDESNSFLYHKPSVKQEVTLYRKDLSDEDKKAGKRNFNSIEITNWRSLE